MRDLSTPILGLSNAACRRTREKLEIAFGMGNESLERDHPTNREPSCSTPRPPRPHAAPLDARYVTLKGGSTHLACRRPGKSLKQPMEKTTKFTENAHQQIENLHAAPLDIELGLTNLKITMPSK